jgi:hypothetical protein
VYKNGVIDETVPVDALAKTLQDKLMSYQSGSEKVQTGGKKMKKNKKQQINISINVGNTNIIDTESSSSSESDSSSSSDNKSDNELNYKYVVNNVKRKKRKHVS